MNKKKEEQSPRLGFRFVCPPVRMEPTSVVMRALTLKKPWFVQDGICYVMLSSEARVNVQDVIAEAVGYGVQTLGTWPRQFFSGAAVPGNFQRILYLHPRAWSDEHEEYQKARVWPGCPANFTHETDGGKYLGMCVGLYREDVDEGKRIVDPGNHSSGWTQKANQFYHRRLVEREIPVGMYVGARRPMTLTLPSAEHDPYQAAIFMELSLG